MLWSLTDLVGRTEYMIWIKLKFDLPIIRIISGILIVGGSSGSLRLRSAEVFNPDTGLTCLVGDMPEGRVEASMCHGLVCGGRNYLLDDSR